MDGEDKHPKRILQTRQDQLIAQIAQHPSIHQALLPRKPGNRHPLEQTHIGTSRGQAEQCHDRAQIGKSIRCFQGTARPQTEQQVDSHKKLPGLPFEEILGGEGRTVE